MHSLKWGKKEAKSGTGYRHLYLRWVQLKSKICVRLYLQVEHVVMSNILVGVWACGRVPPCKGQSQVRRGYARQLILSQKFTFYQCFKLEICSFFYDFHTFTLMLVTVFFILYNTVKSTDKSLKMWLYLKGKGRCGKAMSKKKDMWSTSCTLPLTPSLVIAHFILWVKLNGAPKCFSASAMGLYLGYAPVGGYM